MGGCGAPWRFQDRIAYLEGSDLHVDSLEVCPEASTALGVLLMQWAACTIEIVHKLALEAADVSMCDSHHVIAIA